MAILNSIGVTDTQYVTARAWVSINGSASPTIIADYNVNSVTYAATGGTPNQPGYLVNLASAVPEGYAVVTGSTVTATGGYPVEYIDANSTTQFKWYIGYVGSVFGYDHNNYACAAVYST